MMYLHGSAIPGNLVKTGLTGIDNIEATTGASFGSLLETFVTRNFLSATGLSDDPALNYGSDLLTDPTTGGRIMPPVADRQIALPATAVTGLVRPTAAAYFRLTAEGGIHDVIITGDVDAGLVAVTIPVDRTFQISNVLPANYLPQLTLDAPLSGDMTSGEAIVIEGTLTNASDDQILFSFEPIETGQDTVKFDASVQNGRFKATLLLGHDQAGTPISSRFSLVSMVRLCPSSEGYRPSSSNEGRDPSSCPWTSSRASSSTRRFQRARRLVNPCVSAARSVTPLSLSWCSVTPTSQDRK